MTDRPLACIILAAGKGTRMKSRLPKVLHLVAGKPILGHLLYAVGQLQPQKIIVVVGDGGGQVAEYAAPHQTVIQVQQNGTGDAAKTAREALAGFAGDIMIVNGDMALIRSESLATLIAMRADAGAALALLGMRPEDPTPYGRLVMGSDGLERIVEALDANAAEKKIGLVNAGPIVVDGALLFDLLDSVGNDNAKGEYYLTDIVKIARDRGLKCVVCEAPEAEAIGINSRAELAQAEALMQKHLREMAMEEGATLIDPATVYFSADTKLGRDVRIEPNVFFGPGVTVEDDAVIKSFCHIEGATIASGAIIGPFARLRPGTQVGEKARVGNFVEIKNTILGEGVKVDHLSYVGDSELGKKAHIGAGTITCNYNGISKSRTTIEEGVFIGSNSTLIAPVTIGTGAIVAAGSVVTHNVPADAMTFARANQIDKLGRASRFRELKKKS